MVCVILHLDSFYSDYWFWDSCFVLFVCFGSLLYLFFWFLFWVVFIPKNIMFDSFLFFWKLLRLFPVWYCHDLWRIINSVKIFERICFHFSLEKCECNKYGTCMFDSSRNCQHDCMFFTFPPAIYESQLFSPTLNIFICFDSSFSRIMHWYSLVIFISFLW